MAEQIGLRAARSVAKSSRKKPRGWNFVFSQCVNCGFEIHRGDGRRMPWIHTNTSPWCPQSFERQVQTFSPAAVRDPRRRFPSHDLPTDRDPPVQSLLLAPNPRTAITHGYLDATEDLFEQLIG
jgi:hypothetical protein